MKQRILFLCTGNSCRSQMAEGLLRHLAGDGYEVASAGTKPSVVHPRAIAVMREIGIDISVQRSKSVKEFSRKQFDLVVTVCDNAKEACPVFPAKTKLVHHSFHDPADARGSEEDILKAFRGVRDEIREYVKREFANGLVSSP